MGIIPVRTIPDKYEEMITTIIAISPNISDYYSSKYQAQWVQECETVDTPQYTCNHLITLVIEELGDMGISVTESLDSILEDLESTLLLVHLRKLFDVKLFCTLYSQTSDEIKTRITSILENGFTDELLSDMVSALYAIFPNNEDLASIIEYEGYYISTDQFKPYLMELINLTENVLNNESTINENVLPVTITYITYVAKHKAEVKYAVDSLLEVFDELDSEYLNDKLATYDMDLLSSDNIKFCALCFDKSDISLIWKTELFKDHMRTHVHHIDYYLYNSVDFPSPNQVALIVAEFFAMATDKEIDPKKLIQDVIDDITLPDDVLKLMLEYITAIPPYILGG